MSEMSEPVWLQLRLRDALSPSVTPVDGPRQILEVLRDGEVVGQLGGWTSAVYELAMHGASKVTFNLIIERTEITTR